jgi:site-specific recombinase XerD
MLERGVDIRYIQECSVTPELSTIELYTQVSIRKLCAVYEAMHPAGTARRQERS